MKNMERKTFWVITALMREEIDWKQVYFNVLIESNPAQGSGHLRYKTRELDDRVSIDLVFNVPDPDVVGGLLEETHGLPQAAVDCILKVDDPDCWLDCRYRAEIRCL